MKLDDYPSDRIVIDWRERSITYREDALTVVSVRFKPAARNSADLFHYCCAIALEQDRHLADGCRTNWTGASSKFLDLLAKEFHWKLADNSRETYWATLARGRRVAQEAADIVKIDNSGEAAAPDATALFSRIDGFVLGRVGRPGDGRHDLWRIDFRNCDDSFAAFRHTVEDLLDLSSGEHDRRSSQRGKSSVRPGPSAPRSGLRHNQRPRGNIPKSPAVFVGRDGVLATLKGRLGFGNVMEAPRIPGPVIMHGMPGVGKSTTAVALAYEPEVLREFTDGVLWISLGQRPTLLSALACWGRLVGIDVVMTSRDVREASERLGDSLRSRRCLLIVDDVWEVHDAVAFNVAGPDCAMLMTTREREVADALAACPEAVFQLGVLDEESSLCILKHWAQGVVDAHLKQCKLLVKQLEWLPLALQVAGRLLSSESRCNWGVEQLLAELAEDSHILEAHAPADCSDLVAQTTPTVAALLRKSTDRLDPRTREQFGKLGLFAPKPATFDLEVLSALWELPDARPVARRLVARGLLEPLGAGRFQLHALLVSHAKSLSRE
jgi:hypothetical protein